LPIPSCRDLFKAAGILLPMGYGQGPGQANNVGGTYETMGFLGGRSFGLSLAASGYLVACIVGVIALNVLIRRGPRAAHPPRRDLGLRHRGDLPGTQEKSP
jgi:Na+/glutamate symporter